MVTRALKKLCETRYNHIRVPKTGWCPYHTAVQTYVDYPICLPTFLPPRQMMTAATISTTMVHGDHGCYSSSSTNGDDERMHIIYITHSVALLAGFVSCHARQCRVGLVLLHWRFAPPIKQFACSMMDVVISARLQVEI